MNKFTVEQAKIVNECRKNKISDSSLLSNRKSDFWFGKSSPPAGDDEQKKNGEIFFAMNRDFHD